MNIAKESGVYSLSWATSESILHRLLPLYYDPTPSHGRQFTWKHLIASVEANINMGGFMALALLVWLWVRKPSHRPSIAIAVLVERFLLPVLTSYVRASGMEGAPAVAVVLQLVATVVFVLAAWRLAASS